MKDASTLAQGNSGLEANLCAAKAPGKMRLHEIADVSIQVHVLIEALKNMQDNDCLSCDVCNNNGKRNEEMSY
jgi:hypothetical protein